MNPPPKRAGRPSGFTFSGATAPRVDDQPPTAAPPAPPPAPDVPTAPTSRRREANQSGRRDAETPRGQDAETPAPLAYTWRITPDEADRLDDLVRAMRRRAGLRRLDRATVLRHLVAAATGDQVVQDALLRRLTP